MSQPYSEVPVTGPAVERFLAALATTRANGNTLLRRFRWSGVRDGWFSTATNLSSFESFRQLLDSDAARRSVPELLEPFPFPSGEPPQFHPVSAGSIKLAGEWAALLVLGGAYKRFEGSEEEALGLAAAAVEELIEGRYEQVAVYYSYEPWSGWFFDVAWDQTWFLVDRDRGEVTLVCTTDTD